MIEFVTQEPILKYTEEKNKFTNTYGQSEFDNMFSFPRTPGTALAPGQYENLNVSDKMKVLITDIYIENLGGGISNFRILEQRDPTSFEVRYNFRTAAQQVTIINFTSGLKLGDEAPITGT